MSLSEIKAEVSRLSSSELEELAACVGLERKIRDPQWVERAVRINREMDAGNAYSEDELRQLHQKLTAEGK